MDAVFQRDVDTELSAMLLRGTVSSGERVLIDARGGELSFETVYAGAASGTRQA